MASNFFGNILKYATWGESHGPYIGCVVDGVPPGIPISESDIQPFLNQRKPATSEYTSPRKEDDVISILSGVFEGRTTGAPISMIIRNDDSNPRDYSEIKKTFRPGHADYTYFLKYKNFNDYRGGGRASARETAMRVAAGAIARKIVPIIKVKGFVAQLGPHKAKQVKIDDASPINLFCPDPDSLPIWKAHIAHAKECGDSVGSIVEIHASGVPPGLGEPVYNKLSASLAHGLMSINAVKGVEIGSGFDSCALPGSITSDEITVDESGNVSFLSNHSGGLLGGISTGAPITIRIALKPPSSIKTPLKTVDKDGQNTTISTGGRHDPCLGPRCVPVAEAMVYLVLADHYLISKVSNCDFAFSNAVATAE